MITLYGSRSENPDMMRRIIEATVRDKFFTIEFVKADGTVRKVNGRLGVEKHKKGGRDCNTKRLCARCWFDKELGIGGYEKTFRGFRKENISTKQRAWFVSPSNSRGNVP